jgi:hypothetical protein
MGHYDDCYASDDFHKMTQKEKDKYYPDFEKKLFEKGSIYGTWDDTHGWILHEWAEKYDHKIKKGYKDFTVEPGDELYHLAKRVVDESK